MEWKFGRLPQLKIAKEQPSQRNEGPRKAAQVMNNVERTNVSIWLQNNVRDRRQVTELLLEAGKGLNVFVCRHRYNMLLGLVVSLVS